MNFAIVADDAAFGSEQRAAYGNHFGFGAVSLVGLQGTYHFHIQIDGAKINACFQHGVNRAARDGVDDGGVKAAVHAAQSIQMALIGCHQVGDFAFFNLDDFDPCRQIRTVKLGRF